MESDSQKLSDNLVLENFNQPSFSALRQLQASISEQAPFLKKVFQSRLDDFGSNWEEKFDTELNAFFGSNQDRIQLAARGYADFAMDAIKLQKKFNQTGEYIQKKYSDLLDAVYLNHDYMFNLYLPGILLSQYLWPHHYRQLEFFLNRFIPLTLAMESPIFFDVGVGTGFYSKEMLRAHPKASGYGVDISPHSLSHAQTLLKSWNFNGRYQTKERDIISQPLLEKADILINVEVLEHLENPKIFLNALYKSLRNNGIAFITAAVNAPNFDHIYLYRSLDEVAEQISSVGFKIVEAVEYIAYQAAPGEIAPSSAVFILRKSEV